MNAEAAITGVGMLTPLGGDAGVVLECIRRGETAAVQVPFEIRDFDCPVHAPVSGFDPEEYFPDNKMLRLMNRDAQMAAAAARLALNDAAVRPGEVYAAEEIALYGSTGTAGMSSEEIARIVQHAALEDGSLSLERFGRVALKRVRPVLSFRILSNMPVCFVSILEDIKGPNAVYTPWEGQGAQAIAAGVRAIRRGEVRCALVGGCDVKCREVSFFCLQQLGLFESWKQDGRGTVPGEGAAFLVLEEYKSAIARGRRPYAIVKDVRMKPVLPGTQAEDTLYELLCGLGAYKRNGGLRVVCAGDGDHRSDYCEARAMDRAGLGGDEVLRPKMAIGNLFAAAAAVQVGLAARLAAQAGAGQLVIANCFGYGSEKASLVLEAA